MPEQQGLWITTEDATDNLNAKYVMGSVYEALPDAEQIKLARQVTGRWAAFPWLPGKEPGLRDGMLYARNLDSVLLTAFASHMRWLAEHSGSAFASARNERPSRQVSFVSDLPISVRNALVGTYIYDPSLDETGLDRLRERGQATELVYNDD